MLISKEGDMVGLEVIEDLRGHVLERLDGSGLDLVERAFILQPFDTLLEGPAFCRLPCNSRNPAINMCSRLIRGLKCEWHQGYD